jgi:hypothetical protein
VRLHGRGIDEDLGRRTAGLRESLEQTDPDALGRPTHIAVVKRFFRSVFRRRVGPASARFQHMNNAADDAQIIDTRLAARVGRKMRRNPRKLRVGKSKLNAIHRRFLSEASNHNAPLMPTFLWVRTRM